MSPVAPPGRPRRLALAPLLLALAACSPAGEAPRYAVAGRPIWTREPGAPALSRTWDFDRPAAEPGSSAAGDQAWTSPDRRPDGPRGRSGRLVLEGDRVLTLTGPHGLAVNPAIHHWLTLRMRSTGVDALTVGWRRAGETFDATRVTSPMPVSSDGNFHTYTVRLSDLRGNEPGAAHADDGVDAFLLRFTGPGEARVTLDQLALLSDYDREADGPQRLDHLGVARRGAALPLPGRVTTTLNRPGPRDRLRLGLALVSSREIPGGHESRSEAPVTVRIRGDGGRLSRQVACTPGAPWTLVDLDLGALAPAAGPVTLTLEGEAGDGAPEAVLLVGGALHLRPAETSLPDVIVYVEDTLRADRLGTYGHVRDTDPHLQHIAAQGVVLERVFAASNWTRPSMSSLLTSLDPVAHGNRTRFRRVPDTLTLLPEVMAEAGYLCAGFVTNFHAADWAGLDQGFDVYHGPRAGGAYRLESTLTSAVIHGPMAALLERNRDVQTFVLAHSFDPHDPYLPPPEDLASLPGGADPPADDLLYDAEILHNDRRLAALDAVLQDLGLLDDTLLMFTSDHGEAFGEHGHFTHRRSLHQEEVAVPWVVRWPAVLPAGLRVSQPASHLDIAPTLLGLLGLAAPDGWRGDDLSARLRGEDGGPPADRPLFLDVLYMEDDDPAHPHEVAVVVAPYKLIARVSESGVPTAHALYDLEADPGERHDLKDDPRAVRIVQGLLDAARAMLDAGPVQDEGSGTADAMDPEMRAWMLEMGYLK